MRLPPIRTDNNFINKTSNYGKLVGYNKGYCNNFALRNKRRTTNRVVVISSTGIDFAPITDFTVLSVKDCIKVSRSKLLSLLIKLKSANNKDIKVRGYLEYDSEIDGHKGIGKCHDADTQSLLGLDWIAQNEPLFRRLKEGTICKMSATTLNRLRSSLIA
ncbi:unnamed protein product [Toxocara canis]|uniref:Peptidase S1 domain-containing protein n=1 Tax=Toxocara canis TaxID=6265 RepID=A0A183V912_TOXCA|nr:unnamed protein product [Toxocara canis]